MQLRVLLACRLRNGQAVGKTFEDALPTRRRLARWMRDAECPLSEADRPPWTRVVAAASHRRWRVPAPGARERRPPSIAWAALRCSAVQAMVETASNRANAAGRTGPSSVTTDLAW